MSSDQYAYSGMPAAQPPLLDRPSPGPATRRRALVAQLAVAVVVLSDIWVITAALGQRSLINRLVDGDRSVSLADAAA
ncbi:MAG: hypothetical protein ACRDVG_07525, partial [Jatrophihabitantaceae bacterium]